MGEKKKLSFEQDQALAHGRNVARANQRRRMAGKDAAQKAEAEREREMAAHLASNHAFSWSNWEYSEDYTHETRTCRVCGATETRKVTL